MRDAHLSRLFNFDSFAPMGVDPIFRLFKGLEDPEWINSTLINIVLSRLINEFSGGNAHCTSCDFFTNIIDEPGVGGGKPNSSSSWLVHLNDSQYFTKRFQSFSREKHQDIEWILHPVHHDTCHFAWVALNVRHRFCAYGDSLRYKEGHAYMKIALAALRHLIEVHIIILT